MLSRKENLDKIIHLYCCVIIQSVVIIYLLFTSLLLYLLQSIGIFKKENSGGKNKLSCLQFSTPEVKLLIVFFYFLIVLFVYWTDFSIQLRNRDKLFTAVNNYASCVRYGDNPMCDKYLNDVRDASFPALSAMSLLMTSLVNFSNVLFVLQFREVKKTLRRLTRRFTSSKETMPDLKRTTQLQHKLIYNIYVSFLLIIHKGAFKNKTSTSELTIKYYSFCDAQVLQKIGSTDEALGDPFSNFFNVFDLYNKQQVQFCCY